MTKKKINKNKWKKKTVSHCLALHDWHRPILDAFLITNWLDCRWPFGLLLLDSDEFKFNVLLKGKRGRFGSWLIQILVAESKSSSWPEQQSVQQSVWLEGWLDIDKILQQWGQCHRWCAGGLRLEIGAGRGWSRIRHSTLRCDGTVFGCLPWLAARRNCHTSCTTGHRTMHRQRSRLPRMLHTHSPNAY